MTENDTTDTKAAPWFFFFLWQRSIFNETRCVL